MDDKKDPDYFMQPEQKLKDAKFALGNTSDPINKIHLEGQIAKLEMELGIRCMDCGEAFPEPEPGDPEPDNSPGLCASCAGVED